MGVGGGAGYTGIMWYEVVWDVVFTTTYKNRVIGYPERNRRISSIGAGERQRN
jgi:hypothetical protein